MLNFIDRKDGGTLAKKLLFKSMNHEQYRIYSLQGFAEEKMESVNEAKCHHMAFLNEIVKDRSNFNLG